jgi:hypothetical protein
VRGTAPWGEVEGDRFIMSLPTEEIEAAEDRGDLRSAVDFWDSVIATHHRLATPPYGARKERIVCDVQLSHGYMHSGYPIMAHMDFAGRALDVVSLVGKGDWGMFHELGHNMQRPWWTWEATGEVTVNLFTVYTMRMLLHKEWHDHDFWQPAIKTKVSDWVRQGRPRKMWDSDPALALYTYCQLIHHFGWNALEAVMREYESTPALQLSPNASGAEKIATWATVYSRVVRRDLTPFFKSWGFNDIVLPSDCAKLPPWTCDVP